MVGPTRGKENAAARTRTGYLESEGQREQDAADAHQSVPPHDEDPPAQRLDEHPLQETPPVSAGGASDARRHRQNTPPPTLTHVKAVMHSQTPVPMVT